MYKFSAPMPYNIEDINKLLDINNSIEKSKITSLYACVPRGCELFTGFEQSRNYAFDNISWDYWKKLIEHVLKRNCDFIYLLNSPRPLDVDNPNFYKQIETLKKLLDELSKTGVNKLRVASAQLMSYIGKHYPHFNVFASTSLEYKTIWEYQNFIEFHPEVRQIIPSHDVNKNFKLLKNLKKRYPDIEFELMINEGCLKGCPNRMFHEMINADDKAVVKDDICFSGVYAMFYCKSVEFRYPVQNLVIGNVIFPWDIEEYGKIDITNFKFVGRDGYIFFDSYLDSFNMYLKGIDDIKNIENFSIADFTHHLKHNKILRKLKVKDCRKYFPDIKHFVKYGHLCANQCGEECSYCYEASEKIQNCLKNSQEIKNEI